jgi:hypothetical protein
MSENEPLFYFAEHMAIYAGMPNDKIDTATLKQLFLMVDLQK